MRRKTWFLLIVFLAAGANAAPKPEYTLRAIYGEHGRGRNELESPSGLAVSDKGKIAVSDEKRNAVILFDEDGRWLKTVGTKNTPSEGFFDRPKGLCFDRRDRIWVADSKNDRLVVLGENGDISMTVGGHGFGKGDLRSPDSVAASSSGRIFVADTGNRRIGIFSNRGEYLEKWSPGDVALKGHLNRPALVAHSPDDEGSIWVVESESDIISRFDLDGNFKSLVDVEKTSGRKVEITAIAVDRRFGWIFLVDGSAGSVLVLNGDGELQAELIPETGSKPAAIAVNGHRDIFIADSGKRRILYYQRN